MASRLKKAKLGAGAGDDRDATAGGDMQYWSEPGQRFLPIEAPATPESFAPGEILRWPSDQRPEQFYVRVSNREWVRTLSRTWAFLVSLRIRRASWVPKNGLDLDTGPGPRLPLPVARALAILGCASPGPIDNLGRI